MSARAVGNGNRAHYIAIACFLAILVLISLRGLQLGVGSHGDSLAIFETSVPAILKGGYAPSRSYGVPLYEAAAAVTYSLGGLWLSNLYSMLLAIASVLVFSTILRSPTQARSPWAFAWALAGFTFNPMFLINASSPTEWSQAMFFLVCSFLFILRWVETRSSWALAAYAITLAGLVLSRPDFAAVALVVFLAVLWEIKLDLKSAFKFVVANVCAGLATAAIYVYINGGLQFFSKAGDIVGAQAIGRRVSLALIGAVIIIGILGCIAVIVALYALFKNYFRGGVKETSLFEKVLLIGWPIMLARFAVLPDKLEYLFPLIPITLLGVTSRRQSTFVVAVVAGSMMLNSIVALSFFARTGGSDKLAFALHANKSALAQDWDARIAANAVKTHKFESYLGTVVYDATAASQPALHYINFNPGFTNSSGDLVMSHAELYKLDNPRFPDPRYHTSSYKRVFVCDKDFIADNVGWRVLQPPPDYVNFGAAPGQGSLRCALDNALKAPSAK